MTDSDNESISFNRAERAINSLVYNSRWLLLVLMGRIQPSK